jgi:hypothetical protein
VSSHGFEPGAEQELKREDEALEGTHEPELFVNGK